MAVESFGAERKDIQGNKFAKLKMKAGDEIRCGVVYFDEDGKKIFLGAKAHVQDKMKTFLCKSTKDHKEVCCTHVWSGNTPMFHIGCVLVVYILGKDENGKMKLKDYELVPWLIWESMYSKLSAANEEFPLVSHDLKLKCVSDNPYVKIDIMSCKESIWSSSPELKKKVVEAAKPIYEAISKNLGAELSLSEIKEILGIEITGSDDAASDVDLGSVVDSIE